jgi:uncharacterized iron-regulated membrane protein
MKATTLRAFLSVHTWVGIVAGLFLFIAFYAGAVSVFTHELLDWGKPVRELPAPTVGLAKSQALLDASLARYPEIAPSSYLILPGEHGPTPTVYWYDLATTDMHRYVADPAQGSIEMPYRSGFVDFVYDLHFTAGLPRTFGTYLFGLVCVLYGLALVSGVVLYTPAFLKDLFALRVGRNLKRMWQDAHNVVGVLSLPFHVIFAWSGAVLCIGLLLLVPFQSLVFGDKLMQAVETDFDIAPAAAIAGTRKPMLPVADLVARAERALPGLEVESLFYANAGDANARVTAYGAMSQRSLNTFGGVAMDATTGDVVKALGPADFPPGMAMLRGLQALHFGSFGGATVKWLYFLLGLAGAFLFYSGNLLWIEARRKRRQPEQPQRARFMASLTLGVCLGCMAGVSAAFVAGALLPEAWVPRAYFAVFFASIAWAFARLPARAGHELLLLCALLTAAVPFADWIGSGQDVVSAFAHGHWHHALPDAVALALAIAFWRMARATLRRGRNGEPNSVWALPAR